MELKEAKRILTLVSKGTYRDLGRAWQDQDKAAKVVLVEMKRLERENKMLETKTGMEEPL